MGRPFSVMRRRTRIHRGAGGGYTPPILERKETTYALLHRPVIRRARLSREIYTLASSQLERRA